MEGRLLEYEDAMRALIPAFAGGFAVATFILFLHKWGLLKREDKE